MLARDTAMKKSQSLLSGDLGVCGEDLCTDGVAN